MMSVNVERHLLIRMMRGAFVIRTVSHLIENALHIMVLDLQQESDTTNRNNGRVSLIGKDVSTAPPFMMFSQDNPNRPLNDFHVQDNSLLKNLQPTHVSDLFFGVPNVNALQEAIRYRVYVETDGKQIIDRQSETELMIVMRSMYLQYSRNSPYNVKEQVRELNAQVLDYCVPKVVSELFAYLQYLKDASTIPVPLAHGELATMKGTRTLEMKNFM